MKKVALLFCIFSLGAFRNEARADLSQRYGQIEVCRHYVEMRHLFERSLSTTGHWARRASEFFGVEERPSDGLNQTLMGTGARISAQIVGRQSLGLINMLLASSATQSNASNLLLRSTLGVRYTFPIIGLTILMGKLLFTPGSDHNDAIAYEIAHPTRLFDVYDDRDDAACQHLIDFPAVAHSFAVYESRYRPELLALLARPPLDASVVVDEDAPAGANRRLTALTRAVPVGDALDAGRGVTAADVSAPVRE